MDDAYAADYAAAASFSDITLMLFATPLRFATYIRHRSRRFSPHTPRYFAI